MAVRRQAWTRGCFRRHIAAMENQMGLSIVEITFLLGTLACFFGRESRQAFRLCISHKRRRVAAEEIPAVSRWTAVLVFWAAWFLVAFAIELLSKVNARYQFGIGILVLWIVALYLCIRYRRPEAK
jgi:hypothetical protein